MSTSPSLIEIDGSVLEGGGQIFRIAICLSALTTTPVHIFNIRSGRSKPGLMAQHLKGLELVRDITSAKCKGNQIGSTEVEFWPGPIQAGSYKALVQTAGSISLLIQVALPCILFANGNVSLELHGGTNAEMAPQIDYTTEVFKPVLEKFGAVFDFDLIKRGYFPKGGGEVIVNTHPVKQLKAVEMLERGDVCGVYGWSFVSGSLPLVIAQNMGNSAQSHIKKSISNVRVSIERYKEHPTMAEGNCSGIIIVAETTTGCLLGGSALGKKSTTPEMTGVEAAEQLVASFNSGSCVDPYIQDQIIVFMALAQGLSKVRTSKITLHTETAIHVAQLITKVKFDIVSKGDDVNIIECEGIGLINKSIV